MEPINQSDHPRARELETRASSQLTTHNQLAGSSSVREVIFNLIRWTYSSGWGSGMPIRI